MTLTKEEAMKQKPPEDVLEEIKKIEIELNIPHRKMKEAFLDYLLDKRLNNITDYTERCRAAIKKLSVDIANPVQLTHFRDKYAYPIPLQRELVIGYNTIEQIHSGKSSTIYLKPITSLNNLCIHDCEGDSPNNTFTGDICLNVDKSIKEVYHGFTPAPFPTYEIDTWINGEFTQLGYEHSGLISPDWCENIISKIKTLIINSKNDETKKDLQNLIKDFI